MRLQCETTGEWITLIQIIHKGGEAKIWETSKSGLVAKIYTKQMIADTWPKLRLMINNPPDDPTVNKNHVSIVWPKCILRDNSGTPKGFLLPYIANTLEFSIIHHPQYRQQKAPGFNWIYLHTTAMNIASVMQCIHQKNYVIGDINSRNILVKPNTYVSIIDTDSFQVTDPRTHKVYRCTVGVDEYRPPEMSGKDPHKIDRYEAQDRFGLAILIWQLLFNDHPFCGKWNGRGEPTMAERISQGHWVYGKNSKLSPVPRIMPFHIINPQLQTLFRRCFDDGHRNPHARPTAGEWQKALELAIKDLQVCSVKGQQHYYAKSYGKCYWCERVKLIGVDIFANPSGASKPSPNILSSSLPTILKNNLSPNIPKPAQPTIPTPLTNLNIPRPTQPTIPTFIGVPTPPKTTPLPTKPTNPLIQWLQLTIVKFKSSPTQQWIAVGLCILSIAVYASWSSHIKKTPSQSLATQSQNTKPENTIIQYYKLTTTNKQAAIKLLSVPWRKEAAKKIKDSWWDSVSKVEVYSFRTFAKSKTNATIKVWLKYYMKNGETACESAIFKLIYDANSNQWLMDSISDVVQKDYCDNQ
jgi:serine/threonine protein kinase